MVALKVLLSFLAATAIAASTVEQVISDITILDDNVKAFTAKVNSYNGGWWRALPQLSAATSVFVSLLAGDATTSSLPPSLSVSDAYLIIDHVKATLAIDNPIAVKALEAKKQQYANAGLAHIFGCWTWAVKAWA